MKRIMTILLVVAMSVSFVSCGKGGTDDKAINSDTEQTMPTEIPENLKNEDYIKSNSNNVIVEEDPKAIEGPVIDDSTTFTEGDFYTDEEGYLVKKPSTVIDDDGNEYVVTSPLDEFKGVVAGEEAGVSEIGYKAIYGSEYNGKIDYVADRVSWDTMYEKFTSNPNSYVGKVVDLIGNSKNYDNFNLITVSAFDTGVYYNIDTDIENNVTLRFIGTISSKTNENEVWLDIITIYK